MLSVLPIQMKSASFFKASALVLTFLFCAALPAYAQKTVEVKEVTKEMSLGNRVGYSLVVENGNKKDIEDVLESFLKQFDKRPDIDKVNKNELVVNDIIIPSISAEVLDMYVLFDEKGKGIEITCFFDMGTSFLSAQVYPTQYQSGIQFMNKFGLKVERSRLEAELKTAASAMEKLEKEKDDLAKRKERLESDISSCESTIENAKKDLKTNAEDTQKKETEIAGSKEQVDGLKKTLSEYPE